MRGNLIGAMGPRSRRLLYGILLLTSLAADAHAARQTVRPLVPPALDLVPPAARDAIGRAYRDAAARPGDPGTTGALARLLHAWEQWDTAHDAYQRAQTLAPRAFEWHYLDAVVLQRLARHAEAAEQLKRAIALDPAYVPAQVKLVDALFESGQYEDCARLAGPLVKDLRTEPMGEFFLGRIAAINGRHQQAVEHLQRAVELFPQWGAAYYALALSYRALDRSDDARRALESHSRYGPSWPGLDDPLIASVAAIRNDGRATLARGIALAGNGDIPGAIAAHEAALVQDATLAQAHANLISLYGRTQQWAKAEAHYRAVLALGEVGNAHYDYGVLLGLQQRWADAAAAYRLAVAVNPMHAAAHNNLGEALERQGLADEALEAYRQAVRCAPEFRLGRFNFARLLLRAGRTEDAIAELERLSDARGAEAPRFLYTLAVAYLRAGRKDEGVSWANKARQLAIEHGQSELAATITRDLAQVK
jgi:tetratricopeptide (TPR) repeat protein